LVERSFRARFRCDILENREWFDDIGREWLTRVLPKGKSGSQREKARRDLRLA
jgi:hypothetical protein